MTNVVLNEVPVQHVAAKVVFQGEKITLPVGMEVPVAIDTLARFMEEQEAQVSVSEIFNVFPWDGAFALKKCLEKRFGFVAFGGAQFSTEVAPGVMESVPWGVFDISGLARFTCRKSMSEGRIVFQVVAGCKKKSENIIRTVFKDVRSYLAAGGSIYQGKAIKLRLSDDNGDILEMPEPKFIDTDAIDVSKLHFNRDVDESLEVSLYTPITRVMDLKKAGIPLNRKVLLAGTYGTGKTMGASKAAKLAVEHGVTYIYIKKASELAQAIYFAKMYSVPLAVIFCEDVDRASNGGRDEKMDELLNVVDGLDTKNTNILVVLTTNDVDTIHPAMLRPGRLDAVINFTTPDKATAELILRQYAGDTLSFTEDLSDAAELLQGQIPAILAECIKRAKLAQLSIQQPGEPIGRLTGRAIFLAAQSMQGQIKLLQDRIDETKPRQVPDVEKALEQVVTSAMKNGGGQALMEKVTGYYG